MKFVLVITLKENMYIECSPRHRKNIIDSIGIQNTIVVLNVL